MILGYIIVYAVLFFRQTMTNRPLERAYSTTLLSRFKSSSCSIPLGHNSGMKNQQQPLQPGGRVFCGSTRLCQESGCYPRSLEIQWTGRNQEFINPNMLCEWSGNGVGNGLGMVSKPVASKVPSTRPLKGLVAMTYSGNEMYTSPMMIMMA